MGRVKNQVITTVKTRTLNHEDLVKLVRESGIPVAIIEKAVGIPLTTLDKCIKGALMVNGAPRPLPAKYEAPLIKYIREKRIEKEELQFEIKETLIEHNIEIKEKEVFIPDEKRKLDWIAKLQEVKTEQNES